MTRRIAPEQAERGAAAEAKFQQWLDRSEAAYIYVDQTIATFSADFADNTKRPDFLVGIPGAGTIAIDVKAKRAINGVFYIDVAEHAAIAQFEFAFSVPAWYALLRPDTVTAYLIPNASLSAYDIIESDAGRAFAVPWEHFDRCNPDNLNFYEAFYRAACLLK